MPPVELAPRPEAQLVQLPSTQYNSGWTVSKRQLPTCETRGTRALKPPRRTSHPSFCFLSSAAHCLVSSSFRSAVLHAH
jgi:hypothetical protein